MQKFAVFGNPIRHSRSPFIHAAFARQADLDIEYTAELSTKEDFVDDITSFFANAKTKGCNITAPFKLQACRLVNTLSEEAKLAGAVNTIAKLSDGSLAGYNTDGMGLLSDITRQGVELGGQSVLVLGAGGAARGVLRALMNQNPESITITNRTVAKAKELIEIAETIKQPVQLEALGFDEIDKRSFDVVINATSLSLDNQIPPISSSVVADANLVYDMVYASQPTSFLEWAKGVGAKKISDGLGMLVGQAAMSFRIWTDFTPNIQPVIAELREQL
ncbi:shikimate dehydrogenase [Alteromonas facilis]|uniref:shikimate dehydrogenase n=1 Tax=Alteromonas facilis TaxID=2048004 RepID=UPI000C291E41|nr:shikimate dehydrogenase [Alteromonas facilis]